MKQSIKRLDRTWGVGEVFEGYVGRRPPIADHVEKTQHRWIEGFQSLEGWSAAPAAGKLCQVFEAYGQGEHLRTAVTDADEEGWFTLTGFNRTESAVCEPLGPSG